MEFLTMRNVVSSNLHTDYYYDNVQIIAGQNFELLYIELSAPRELKIRLMTIIIVLVF